MRTTEKDAASKTCPQPDFIKCQGSKCMAWRWAEVTEVFTVRDHRYRTEGRVSYAIGYVKLIDMIEGEYLSEWQGWGAVDLIKKIEDSFVGQPQYLVKRVFDEDEENRVGYCGLAGRPEE